MNLTTITGTEGYSAEAPELLKIYEQVTFEVAAQPDLKLTVLVGGMAGTTAGR